MSIVQISIPEVRTVKGKGIINRTHTEYEISICVNIDVHTRSKRYKEFDRFFTFLKK
jgi:hypothetical protein